MSFKKLLLKNPLIKHIALAIGLITLILIGTFVSLSIYTHHGEAFEVPDFNGLTESQFIDLIQQKELRYKIIDSVYINNETPGVVVEQTPKPGQFVKENRTIFFTINAYTAEQVSMPKLLDYSLRNAQVTLESYGLRVGQLIYIPSQYTNLVLDQYLDGKPIEPGTLVKKGTSIDILVGKGLSKERTSVPDLFSMKLEDAILKCQSVSLNVESVVYDESILTLEDSLNAFIWMQKPEAEEGKNLQLGSSLDVWLTIDSMKIAPDTISAEDIIVSSLEDTIEQ